MTGRARAWGAITILNATATGIGCALAVEVPTVAEWSWTGDVLRLQSGGDERVAQAIAGRRGAIASCQSAFPPSRGLKTSSSAAASLLRAAHRADGNDLAGLPLVRASVATARQAGVTLTGAFDDQCAVVLGGCRITDNHRDTIVQELAPERWHVAVWVPEAAIAKSAVARVDFAGALADVAQAERLARRGDLAQALTCNGAVFGQTYAQHGLPISYEPVQHALAAGALGAGLSGTGPAVAALFDAPCRLDPVPGGHWMWTRVAEGEA